MNTKRYRPFFITLFGCLALVAVTAMIDRPALMADEADVLTVQAGEGKLYAQPVKIAPVIEVLEKGARLLLLHQKGEWCAVSLPDQRLGWAHQSIFAPETAAYEPEKPADPVSLPTISQEARGKRAVLKVNSGRVRSAPSLDAELVFGLSRGARFTILAQQGDWYYIQSQSGQRGWLYHTLVDFSQPIPPETEDKPAESANPSMESDATPVAVDHTTPQPEPAAGDTENAPTERDDASDTAAKSAGYGFQVVVKVRSGRVRTGPSMTSPTAFGILRGTRAEVVAAEGRWYRILLPDGRTGWAYETLFDMVGQEGVHAPEAPPNSAVKELRAIDFDTTPEGHEVLTIELNAFNPPKTYTINDKTVPLVVCEFADTRLSSGIGKTIPTHGKLVTAVSIRQTGGADSPVRVEAALDPRFKYSVDQVFFKKNNRYVVTFKK